MEIKDSVNPVKPGLRVVEVHKSWRFGVEETAQLRGRRFLVESNGIWGIERLREDSKCERGLLWDLVVGVSSNACPYDPSGEDLCIRQMAGCNEKTGIDLKRLDLSGGLNSMGLLDSLDGYDCTVACGSCSLSSASPFWCSACLLVRYSLMSIIWCMYQ